MKLLGFFVAGCFHLATPPPLLAQGGGNGDGSKSSQEEGAVIKIIGPQREILRPRHAGQSVVIRPSEETRFDIKHQLDKESSLILPETGRVNASGFSVPRVRGQDARFTEIYLEGLRIQDPYLGYPFIDDLDLRATGEMALYIGTPPPEFASVNPNGGVSK